MKVTMLANVFFLCACVGIAATAEAFANEEFGRTANTRGLALKRKISWKSAPPKSSMSKGKSGSKSKSKGGTGGMHTSMAMSMFVSHKSSKGKFSASKFSMDEYLFSELDRETLFADMSMSMSMSMSYGYPGKPSAGGPSKPSVGSPNKPSVVSPNKPSVTMPSTGSSPSLAPVVLPPALAPSSTGSTPTVSPTVSEGPTQTMGPTLTAGPTQTVGPTSTAGPAAFDDDLSLTDDFIVEDDAFNMTSEESIGMDDITQTTVFDFDEETGSVVIVEPPIGESTVVRLAIEYFVDADVNETEAFEADIDEMIFVTAVMASVGATRDSGVFRSRLPSRRLDSGMRNARHLLSTSSFRRPCSSEDNVSVEGANCFIMDADIVYILNGDRDVRFPAYYAYLALEDQMGSYAAELPDVLKVGYIGPTPELPTVAIENNPPSGDQFISSANDRIGATRPWVIAAGFGTVVFCGVVLAAVLKRRRNRDRYIEPFDVEGDVCDTSPESSPRESAQREVVTNPV